ncbi:MAG TPA: CocE/NonD family hydrolase [Hyphomicrobiaceae bacterium]|nr:CocE/NonD family hydrolase [Hyphomicrobiaceae bacterium]
MREQLWMLPSGDPGRALRATVFRPPEPHAGRSRFPLVLINHGSDEANRQAVSMPVFYWLSRWFVDRGYAVVLPQRRGFGATGGELVEATDSCRNPDHYGAGLAAAEDVGSALDYMSTQHGIEAGQSIAVGISTGGWASLALAARNPPNLAMVVNFAGGRGGHAYGVPGSICGPDRLVEAAAAYGRTARVPTLWIYARNDSYFGSDIANRMAKAWKEHGGKVDLVHLPAYGREGHALVDDRAGWELWGSVLEHFLLRHSPAMVAGRSSGGEAAAR